MSGSVKVSLNEVSSMVKRAALGAGWSDGLATEAGRAAACLSGLGGDGPRAALAECQTSPTRVSATKTEDGWLFASAPAIAVGPSIFEVLETDPDKAVTVQGAAMSALVQGYAAAASTRFGRMYRVEVHGDDLCVQIQPGTVEASGPIKDSVVETAIWDALGRLAMNSYVAATAQSRIQGAGAGLNDND